MMTNPVEEHRRWEIEVRDPAEAAAEPERVIKHGHRRASYRLAPIPGGWAWQADAQTGYACYFGTPWRGPVATRDTALLAAINHIRHHYRYREGDNEQPGADQMIALVEAERYVQEAMF